MASLGSRFAEFAEDALSNRFSYPTVNLYAPLPPAWTLRGMFRRTQTIVSAVLLRAVWGVLTPWCWCLIVYSPIASLGMLHVCALLCLCLGLAAFYALAARGRYHAGALIERGRGSFAGTRSRRVHAGSGWVRCALYMLCFCTFCQAAACAPIARASAGPSPPSQPHSCFMDPAGRDLDSRQARPRNSGHAAPSRKRALRRAIGRAARHPTHTTTYKGRSCNLQNLQVICRMSLYQGCMILVRKTLAPFDAIRWSTPLQGHVLHVRLPAYGKTVDLVNVYQYAVHTGSDSAETMRKRERVLHHLEKTLSSLPIRNMLLMGGDFNTTGTRDVKAFGPGVFISKNPRPDRRHLANLVTTHRLTALNTWSRLSRAFTYEHENAQSQIDFFFAREAQIDGLARQAKLDHCRCATSSDRGLCSGHPLSNCPVSPH